MPPPPTLTNVRIGDVCPATKIKFDAVGRGAPLGETVTKPDAEGSVTVTFNTTAPTPDAGTPPRPTTLTSIVAPWPTAPPPLMSPSIVRLPGRVLFPYTTLFRSWLGAVGNQPTTSATR